MQLHQLKRIHKNIKKARVGRGGKRGKTSGRGTKGQLARAGRKLRPELRDIIKKIPKLRGRGRNFLKSIKKPAIPVNVSLLDKYFSAGDTITPAALTAKEIIRVRKGQNRPVKILGDGEISKKLTLSGLLVSKSARIKIEKAGGAVS